MTEEIMQNYKNFYEKKFVDQIKLEFRAGSGGSGAATFFRDRSVTTGAPDGGDGGTGGSIYLRANVSKQDFHMFKRLKIIGNNGKPGEKGGRFGKSGKDLHINVPVGTLVYQILNETQTINEAGVRKVQYNKKFIGDLDENGKELLIVKGGKGGRGNQNHRSIIQSERGQEGEQKSIYLELKIIADCGLVGFPNAGKSTFIASVSRCLPKIANYPFTTLNPLVGKVKFVDNASFTIADIPGIIEDSHKNKGLGLDFLRHIERTNVLVYLIDISQDKSIQEFQTLQNELLQYKKELQEKPFIVVANKMDLEQNCEQKIKFLQDAIGQKVFLISAKHGYGIGEVIIELRKILENLNKNLFK